MAEEWLSVKDAAAALGVQEKSVRNAEKNKRFPNARRTPRGKSVTLEIPRSDVEAYKRTRRRTTRRRTPSAQSAGLSAPAPERVSLLRAALEIEENPSDRTKIAELLRQVAALLSR
jgi:Helix-turn-helix domain